MSDTNQLPHITYRPITTANKADLNLPNEAFSLVGRLIPSLKDGVWSYETTAFETVTTMCFPEENYDFEAMAKDFVMIGAYLGERCVGLALLEHQMFKYLYLYDLKVSGAYRHLGIGSGLIEASKKIARELGYLGIYTVAQDNNLRACLFYLKNGLEIGGVNTHIYKGTSQAEKVNIYFYEK